MSSTTILTPGTMPVAPGTAPEQGFFDDLNAEVGDKGFLVTSTEDLFNWARTGSLWWMTFGLARSEEHTSELQSLMRISYAVFCLNKKTHTQLTTSHNYIIYRTNR